jgi:hypothetical protein
MKSVVASLIHGPPRFVVAAVVTATELLSAVARARGRFLVWPGPSVAERLVGFAERESFSNVAETVTEAVDELPKLIVATFEPSLRTDGISVRVITVFWLEALPLAGVTCSHSGRFCALKLPVPPVVDKPSDLPAGAGRP